jgi:alpha-D-ribose 1-methylphosphonate 5-triphosphate synthase subunit PhnI
MPRFFRDTPSARSRMAQARLGAARRRFDLSAIALRKAALDHVEGELLVSAALRATLARLAGSPGPTP